MQPFGPQSGSGGIELYFPGSQFGLSTNLTPTPDFINGVPFERDGYIYTYTHFLGQLTIKAEPTAATMALRGELATYIASVNEINKLIEETWVKPNSDTVDGRHQYSGGQSVTHRYEDDFLAKWRCGKARRRFRQTAPPRKRFSTLAPRLGQHKPPLTTSTNALYRSVLSSMAATSRQRIRPQQTRLRRSGKSTNASGKVGYEVQVRRPDTNADFSAVGQGSARRRPRAGAQQPAGNRDRHGARRCRAEAGAAVLGRAAG